MSRVCRLFSGCRRTTGLLGVIFLVMAFGGGSVALLASPSVLETDSGEDFPSLELALEIPDLSLAPTLSFEFGFGTDESVAPETLYDSFSITLQYIDSSTALILTADATGVAWAPYNPGGLELGSEAIGRTPRDFGAFDVSYGLEYAYLVSVELPPGTVAGEASLFLDLFDDHDLDQSLAWLDEVVIDTKAPEAPTVELLSSADATGPFAREAYDAFDPATRTFKIRRAGRQRFFRIVSNTDARITRTVRRDEVWEFEFEEPETAVVLQRVENIGDAFEPVAAAQVDLANRTIRVPRTGASGFFRIQSRRQAEIVGYHFEGEQFVLAFEFEPAFLTFQSSAQPNGPYANESRVEIDRSAGLVRLPLEGGARFYRVEGDRPHRITSIQSSGDHLLISYASALQLQSAPTASGPFLVEARAVFEEAAGTITVPLSGPIQFYRIVAASPRRITSISVDGQQVVLAFE